LSGPVSKGVAEELLMLPCSCGSVLFSFHHCLLCSAQVSQGKHTSASSQLVYSVLHTLLLPSLVLHPAALNLRIYLQIKLAGKRTLLCSSSCRSSRSSACLSRRSSLLAKLLRALRWCPADHAELIAAMWAVSRCVVPIKAVLTSHRAQA
jgi:hypothetical protein